METIKKAEHWRVDPFELWCWRRLLRVSWTGGRSNQSILKETSPKYSLEGLMLKLKLQYFGHLMQRANSLEKTPMPGKVEGRRRRDDWAGDSWMGSLTLWTWVWAWDGEGQGSLACCSPWGHKELDTTEWLNNSNNKPITSASFIEKFLCWIAFAYLSEISWAHLCGPVSGFSILPIDLRVYLSTGVTVLVNVATS